MKLSQILGVYDFKIKEDIEVTKLVTSSFEASKDTIFLALKGNLYDGNDYILDVLEKGCKAVISEKKSIYDHVYKVKNIRKIKNKLTEMIYQNIINTTIFIGVTGTNGKTTTSNIIYQMLRKDSSINVILVGTNGIFYQDVCKEIDNTTPDELVIFNFILDNIENNKKTYVVMEVSSHALSLKRIEHINFDIAIYLNLSHEHLDYYNTIENYANAKSILFKKLKNNKIAIINIDDNYAYKMINLENKNIAFGKTCRDNKLIVIDSNLENIKFSLNDCEYQIPLIGNYNAYNASSAILCLLNLGYNEEQIKELLNNIENIPGRMELYRYHHKNVIIDFAHTPQAMKKVLMFLRTQTSNKIITLFGCGGNRDKDKRPKMMEIASLYSDEVYLTSDNPRFEDPLDIMKDALMGIKNDRVHLYVDRRLAIYNAIKSLNKDEYLVILGKGHEKYQIVLDTKIKFSDLEEVEKWII